MRGLDLVLTRLCLFVSPCSPCSPCPPHTATPPYFSLLSPPAVPAKQSLILNVRSSAWGRPGWEMKGEKLVWLSQQFGFLTQEQKAFFLIVVSITGKKVPLNFTQHFSDVQRDYSNWVNTQACRGRLCVYPSSPLHSAGANANCHMVAFKLQVNLIQTSFVLKFNLIIFKYSSKIWHRLDWAIPLTHQTGCCSNGIGMEAS